MGDRGKVKGLNPDIWTSFDYGTARYDADGRLASGWAKQSPDKIAAILAAMEVAVKQYLQYNGAVGTKKKRALKRFREYVRVKSVQQAAIEAIRIGVERENLNNMALLLKD